MAGENHENCPAEAFWKVNLFKMKNFIFATIVAFYFVCLGCSKTDKSEPTPSTANTEVNHEGEPDNGIDQNVQIGFRSCGAALECEVTVTTDVDATLDICGDVPLGSGNCAYADCDNDPTFSAGWQANIARSFCVSWNGNFCIRNNNGYTVVVSINGGTGVSIPNGSFFCWRLSGGSSCTITAGC